MSRNDDYSPASDAIGYLVWGTIYLGYFAAPIAVVGLVLRIVLTSFIERSH